MLVIRPEGYTCVYDCRSYIMLSCLSRCKRVHKALASGLITVGRKDPHSAASPRSDAGSARGPCRGPYSQLCAGVKAASRQPESGCHGGARLSTTARVPVYQAGSDGGHSTSETGRFIDPPCGFPGGPRYLSRFDRPDSTGPPANAATRDCITTAPEPVALLSAKQFKIGLHNPRDLISYVALRRSEYVNETAVYSGTP